MMTAREVSEWFHGEKGRHEARERERADAERRRSTEARSRRQAALEWELTDIARQEGELRDRIALLPPGYLHNRFDITGKKRLKDQLARFDALETLIAGGFNPGLLRFGSPLFSCVAMVGSLCLAYLWMQNRFGTDAIGGSEVLTLLVVVGAAIGVDVVAFLLLGGLLASARNFISRQRFNFVLVTVMALASLTGVVGFAMMLFNRIMEAGL